MELQENPVFAAIYGRRSIRNYQDRPVEREKIVRLLQAAMTAPSFSCISLEPATRAATFCSSTTFQSI